jgi:hypothetical protein
VSKILPAAGSQLFDAAVFNAQIPKEGPKATAVVIPFTSTDTSFDLNLLLTQSQQFMSLVQAAFVDNSDNPADLEIVTSVLFQSLIIPAGSQAYVPLLTPKNATLTFNSTGAVTVRVILLNVPVPAAVWSVDTPGATYEVVAAGQAAQVLGTTGAVGDYLTGLLIIPANVNPGVVQIIDGGTTITVFVGGAASVSTLIPFFVPVEAISRNAAWKVTTGADVSVLATGRFT